jgi:hypothetical protein
VINRPKQGPGCAIRRRKSVQTGGRVFQCSRGQKFFNISDLQAIANGFSQAKIALQNHPVKLFP